MRASAQPTSAGESNTCAPAINLLSGNPAAAALFSRAPGFSAHLHGRVNPAYTRAWHTQADIAGSKATRGHVSREVGGGALRCAASSADDDTAVVSLDADGRGRWLRVVPHQTGLREPN